jgi:hypothetical protein
MTPYSNLIKFLTLSTMLSVINTASAQAYKYLGENDNYKYHITSDKVSMRFGRGVVAWVISESEELNYAKRYFISCDGKYLSNDSFGFEISTKGTKAERRNEISQLIKASKNSETGYVDIDDFDSSELPIKNKIKSSLKDVCASASQERKGLLLPFFQSVYNKEGVAFITSLTSGTISRKSELVEGWVKRHQVTRQEMRKSNGEPFLNDQGKPLLYDKLKDESYTMSRLVVNCKEEKYAFLMVTDYDNYGTPKPNSINVTKPNFQSAIPNTEGDLIIQTFCRVY